MRAALFALAFAAALATPATAGHCTTWSTTSSTDFGVFVGEAGHYVFTECWTYDPQCNMTFWIYEESNGIPGLQRNDDVEDDTCHGLIVSDTLTF